MANETAAPRKEPEVSRDVSFMYLANRVEKLDEKVEKRGDQLSIKIDSLREELSSRIDANGVKIDSLRKDLTAKIDDVDARLNSRIDANGVRIDNLRGELLSKIDTSFKWTLGIMIPMWVTIILSILAILFK